MYVFVFSPGILVCTIPQKVRTRCSVEPFRMCVFDGPSWTSSGHAVPLETRLHLVKLNFNTSVGNMIKPSRNERFCCPFFWWPLYTVSQEGGISASPLRDVLRRKNNFKHPEPSIKSHFSLSIGIKEHERVKHFKNPCIASSREMFWEKKTTESVE